MIPTPNFSRSATDAMESALAALPPSLAAAMRHLGQPRRWHDGELMMRGGEVASGLLLILDGRARLARNTVQGEQVFMRWLFPGELVGLASVLGRVPFTVDAVAVGETLAMRFEADALRNHLATDAPGALALASVVSAYLTEIVELLAAFNTGNLEVRIASFLDRLASHEPSVGEGWPIRLAATQQDIAHAVGASRQRVSTELRKLEAHGYLQQGYGYIDLLQPFGRRG